VVRFRCSTVCSTVDVWASTLDVALFVERTIEVRTLPPGWLAQVVRSSCLSLTFQRHSPLQKEGASAHALPTGEGLTAVARRKFPGSCRSSSAQYETKTPRMEGVSPEKEFDGGPISLPVTL
jgi:hypothetical protein